MIRDQIPRVQCMHDKFEELRYLSMENSFMDMTRGHVFKENEPRLNSPREVLDWI